MLELQRIQDTGVGFIDPYIIFKTDIIVKEQWVSEAQKNIMRFFVRVMQKDHLKAVQESIAGFLLEKVINPNGEFYFDPKK